MGRHFEGQTRNRTDDAHQENIGPLSRDERQKIDAMPLFHRVRPSHEHPQSAPCAWRSRRRPWKASSSSASSGPANRPRHSLRRSKSTTVSRASTNHLNPQEIVNASVSGKVKLASPNWADRTTIIENAGSACETHRLRLQVAYPCPYTLHDRLAAFNCHRHGFTTPASVVDHLIHDHRARPRCPICGATFPTHAACDKHIVSRSCELSETIPSVDMEGLSSAQADRLELVLDWWEYFCQTQQGSDREGACMQWDDCYLEICRVVLAEAEGASFEGTSDMDCEDGTIVLWRVLDEARNVVEERGGEGEGLVVLSPGGVGIAQ